jgi:hypothetical protein
MIYENTAIMQVDPEAFSLLLGEGLKQDLFCGHL